MVRSVDLRLSPGPVRALRHGDGAGIPALCIPALCVPGLSANASVFWKALRMPTLLVRAARPLLPDADFIVGAPLRDAFLAAVPSAEAAEVDANHYGVMAHPDALRAIDRFLAR
jgi:hypothetical protein